MPDISLVWDNVNARADIAMAGAGLAMGNDLETAVLISLFTDHIAEPGDILAAGQATDPRGWWADTYEAPDLIGSKLWQAFWRVRNQDTLNWARDTATGSLQWMLDDGVASSVQVAPLFYGSGGLALRIAIVQPAGNTSNFLFAWAGINAAPTIISTSTNAGVGLGPSLSLNFVNNGPLDSRIVFGRASVATYFDGNGIMQTAANNVARFDHDPTLLTPRGLLIEEARTNSLPNSTMVGAVAGTPGTLPTNWLQTENTGVIPNVIGSGTENGIPYVDIQFLGTTTGGTNNNIFFSPTVISAGNSQAWTASCYMRVVAGSLGAVPASLFVIDSAAAHSVAIAPPPTGASLASNRFVLTATSSASGVTAVTSAIQLDPPIGTAMNVTLRIGAPQLELGRFATSFIPTSSAAVTRQGDIATLPVIAASGATNFRFNQPAGTIGVEALVGQLNNEAVELAGLASILGKTSINVQGGNSVAMFDLTAPVNAALGVQPVATVFRAMYAFTAGAQAGLIVGSGLVTSAGTPLTPGITGLTIGTDSASQQPNGYLRRIQYWPRALAAPELQAGF